MRFLATFAGVLALEIVPIMEQAKSPLRDGAALTFALFFPTVLSLVAFVVLDEPEQRANPALLTAFSAGKGVQFLFPILYVWWFYRAEIGFVRPNRAGLLLGGGFGLLVGVAMFALYFAWVRHIPAVADKTPQMIYDRLRQFGRDTPLGYLHVAIVITLVHSLAEEYYWRWFVFGWSRRYLPVFAAIVLSSIGFMLHHIVILGVYFPGHFWTLAMPFSICVAVGGGVWAWLYERSGSLLAPWLSHALIDAAIMLLGYEMVRGYWN